MRKSGWTPSIVPHGDDQTVYIVADDFGRNGRASGESDVETAELETTITGLPEGEYSNPVRIIAFNTAEKWSQDISGDIAQELRRRSDLQLRDVPSSIQDFVEKDDPIARENLLLLEYLTIGPKLRRLVAIVKQRASAHETSAREFFLTGRGIEVAPDARSAAEVVAHADDYATGHNQKPRAPEGV